MEFCNIHLTILQEAHEISIHHLSLRIIIRNLLPHLPGANELKEETFWNMTLKSYESHFHIIDENCFTTLMSYQLIGAWEM